MLRLHPAQRPAVSLVGAAAFAASAAALGFGIARRLRESVYAGAFFLVVAATALAVVFAHRRLRATLSGAATEVRR